MSKHSEHILPENDPDLKLAKDLNKPLGERSSEDALIHLLNRFKKSELESRHVYFADSESAWSSLSEKLTAVQIEAPEPRSQKPASIIPLMRNWQAAAAVVLIGLLSFFIVSQFSNSESLVAESGSSSETVILEDGSTVLLRAHSKLWASSDANFRLEGEAQFEVTHKPERVFSVSFDESTVNVLGTRFIVKTWGGLPSVTLLEGSVEIVANSQKRRLEPNQSAMIREGLIDISSDRAALEQAKDWVTEHLYLDSVPVSEVLNEIAHQFNIDVQADAQFNSQTISGSIPLGSREQVFTDLELLFQAEFVEVQEDVFVLRAVD